MGEIVFHREYEVRGVVLGWDREARAPLTWLRQVYSEEQSSLYTDPHYTVICDTAKVGVILCKYLVNRKIFDKEIIHLKIQTTNMVIE